MELLLKTTVLIACLSFSSNYGSCDSVSSDLKMDDSNYTASNSNETYIKAVPNGRDLFVGHPSPTDRPLFSGVRKTKDTQ